MISKDIILSSFLYCTILQRFDEYLPYIPNPDTKSECIFLIQHMVGVEWRDADLSPAQLWERQTRLPLPVVNMNCNFSDLFILHQTILLLSSADMYAMFEHVHSRE